jgi:Zn-dependent membrane protease YugP
LFDPLYLTFWLPGLALALGAQFWLKSSFKRYSEVLNRRGISGAQAARRILDAAGLSHVSIEAVAGRGLGDHYDPRTKVLRLSSEVHTRHSLAAVGVAAHEAGHALQDAKGYAPMQLRSKLVPVATIGSQLAFPLLFLGMFLQMAGMVKFGVILFGAVVLFQLVTLPVEFDASRRAMVALETGGILDPDELGGAKSVLTAAAMTYVAAAAGAILQLTYFLLRSGLLGGSDE